MPINQLLKLKDLNINARLENLTSTVVNNDLLLSILVSLILIIVGVTFGYENNQKVPITHSKSVLYRLEPKNSLSFMSNWDGPIYINIAKHGYSQKSSANFFPLYPVLISIVNKVISSPLYSALIVAWASVVGAIYFYLRVVKSFFKIKDNITATKALLLFILFPSAVFLLATLTESLFAFLSLAAIYFAMKNRYILAGVFSMFATSTKPTGIFILILLGLILIENRLKLTKVFLSMLIGSVGILGYMAYLYIKYANPFEFIVTQNHHGWFQHLLIAQSRNLSPMNIIFLIPIVISVFYWWKRKKSFSIYSILFILIPLLGGQFGGFVRYALMAFPVFLMFYDYLRNRKLLYIIVLMLSTIGWSYILLQYAGGYIGG